MTFEHLQHGFASVLPKLIAAIGMGTAGALIEGALGVITAILGAMAAYWALRTARLKHREQELIVQKLEGENAQTS